MLPSSVPMPRLPQNPVPMAQSKQPKTGPRPVFRAQAPDESVPPARPAPTAKPELARLALPSPEELGIGPTTAALESIDWRAVRNQLDRLGAVCFNLEKRTEGGYRFTCLLTTPTSSRNHRVEATAGTEAEAVRLALEKSEQWASARR